MTKTVRPAASLHITTNGQGKQLSVINNKLFIKDIKGTQIHQAEHANSYMYLWSSAKSAMTIHYLLLNKL